MNEPARLGPTGLKLTIVDVFAERVFEGNQLAVVEGAADLDPAAMQRIAREMNFSETTFVVRASRGDADVRIFTPHEELPFAGHPTLGTAWVLAGRAARYRLNLADGPVDVRLDGNYAVMVPPEPELRAGIDRSTAAGLVGVELDAGIPPRLTYSGDEYCIVPVASLSALRSVTPGLESLRTATPSGSLFAVCRGGYSADADFAARMFFFDGTGLREDPATGSANSAFAAYLRDLGQPGNYIVEQGFELGRPSRLYLGVGSTLEVGGRVQLVAEGSLRGA